MADEGDSEVQESGIEEQEDPILAEGDDLDLPSVRRSERKKAPRSGAARGRPKKSGPKSPMMRMAEMRKGGLRGRALRNTGMKETEGYDLKSSKGKKGRAGRGLHLQMRFSTLWN